MKQTDWIIATSDLSKTEWTGSRKVAPRKGLNLVDAMYTWFGCNALTHSPPKLGGVPSRSEGGAVCSKTRSDLMDFREALLINRYCSSLNRPPQPSLREGIPA